MTACNCSSSLASSSNVSVSLSGDCDSATGFCYCQQYVTGDSCDRCVDNAFNFSVSAGCQQCHCHPVGSSSQSCNDVSNAAHTLRWFWLLHLVNEAEKETKWVKVWVRVNPTSTCPIRHLTLCIARKIAHNLFLSSSVIGLLHVLCVSGLAVWWTSVTLCVWVCRRVCASVSVTWQVTSAIAVNPDIGAWRHPAVNVRHYSSICLGPCTAFYTGPAHPVAMQNEGKPGHAYFLLPQAHAPAVSLSVCLSVSLSMFCLTVMLVGICAGKVLTRRDSNGKFFKQIKEFVLGRRWFSPKMQIKTNIILTKCPLAKNKVIKFSCYPSLAVVQNQSWTWVVGNGSDFQR